MKSGVIFQLAFSFLLLLVNGSVSLLAGSSNMITLCCVSKIDSSTCTVNYRLMTNSAVKGMYVIIKTNRYGVCEY